MTSPLRGFNYRSVDDLLAKGVGMVYDRNHYMTKGGKSCGIYHYEKKRVYIYPDLEEQKEEDVTILHEWLHAYEYLIIGNIFRDKQVDWWAHFHLRRDEMFADYIRSFFPEFDNK